jgi:WD40 repeat protein
MSGYRNLHRYKVSNASDDNDGNENVPIWSVQLSPCNQTHLTTRASTSPSANAPLRLVTSSADGLLRAYTIADKSISADSDKLDATALNMMLSEIMLPSSDMVYPHPTEVSDVMTLGCVAVSLVRNYVGEDTQAGGEIAASLRLDGKVSIWAKEEQPLFLETNGSEGGNSNTPIRKPAHEFTLENSAGSTMTLIPPQLTGHTKHGLIMMVGCLDGSVTFIATGIVIPNSLKNGDKIYHDMGTVLDTVGVGNSVPTALALQPEKYLTFAVGRKNGTIDVFSSTGESGDFFGTFRRIHRLTHHAGAPVRALCFTPDGALLISGSDDGHIFIFDTSSLQTNQTIRMVATILNAHKSYILSVDVLPDSKRFVTSSADKTVKVWNAGTPNSGPEHTFDTGHEDMVWGLSCSSDGRKCVSCGDEGLLQVYSCEE